MATLPKRTYSAISEGQVAEPWNVQPAVSTGGCCASPRMRSGVFEWPEEEVEISNVV